MSLYRSSQFTESRKIFREWEASLHKQEASNKVEAGGKCRKPVYSTGNLFTEYEASSQLQEASSQRMQLIYRTKSLNTVQEVSLQCKEASLGRTSHTVARSQFREQETCSSQFTKERSQSTVQEVYPRESILVIVILPSQNNNIVQCVFGVLQAMWKLKIFNSAPGLP